jgi:hypothetical protein
MPLSDVALRSAKPTDSVQKLSDGGGLQLWIMPNVSKLWRLAYRFDGKQKKLSVGRYPSVGLSEARATRDMLPAKLNKLSCADQIHGLMSRTPVLSKSAILRVTTVRP